MDYRRDAGEGLRQGERAFHGLVIAVMIVAVAVLYLTDSLVREVVFACFAAATIPAMAIGMRVNRVAYRLPWRLALTAMCFLTVGNAWQVMRMVRDTSRTFGQPVMQVVMLVAYLLLLAGSLLLVLRRAPHDRGRVIEAALVGLVGAGLLWEVVLRPRLDARMAPAGSKTVVLVQVLTLFAVLGTLLKVVRMERRGRGSLSYLFLAIFATLANVLFTTLVPGGGQLRGVVTGIWTVAYFSLAAAVLYPGITAFSSAEGGGYREDLSPVRLAYLGAALWTSPMLGVVPVVLHRPADLLLRECAGPDDVVGRVGGDEFLILSRGATEPECHDLARRVQVGCEAPIPFDGGEARVGVTIGYAISDGLAPPSADALVAAADQAMYERKRAKRQTAVVCGGSVA